MGAARQTELDGNGFGHVGQACPRSNRAWARPGAKGEDGHMLARVIKAAESRIVPVVRCDHAIIRGPYRGFDSAEPSIEGLETGGITRDVAAMAPFGIKINQIDEDESALRGRRERIKQKIDIAVVALALAF